MALNNSPFQIAIDGPVAAGKGDIAFRLAKELHLLYINTGAMYRMLALSCINRGISTRDREKVIEALEITDMTLLPPKKDEKEKTFIALLDGTDVTERIAEPDVAAGSSYVGVIAEVRKKMVLLQKTMAKGKRVVMEGRDIGIRVLPDAQLKIYLTASLEERVKRRLLQWKKKGIVKTYKEVLKDVKERDYQDTHRKSDPLQKLPDAWELDTTNLSQDEVIRKIKEELQKRNLL